jgi:hypothetical protein
MGDEGLTEGLKEAARHSHFPREGATMPSLASRF